MRRGWICTGDRGFVEGIRIRAGARGRGSVVNRSWIKVKALFWAEIGIGLEKEAELWSGFQL